MQEAADNLRPDSGMAAVTGLDPKQAEELITFWKDSGKINNDLFAANINSPRQLVVSGTAAALAEAESLFKEAGAKRVIRLQVAGPFHSPLMEEARKAFQSVLDSISFSNPAIPFYSNVTGKKIETGSEAKNLAALHITSPVRWTDEEAAVAADGIDICLEAGPGRVLQGLWKDSGSSIPIYAAGTADDILGVKL
jgi:[acyl-carrier-protein] S-malonyltransferase